MPHLPNCAPELLQHCVVFLQVAQLPPQLEQVYATACVPAPHSSPHCGAHDAVSASAVSATSGAPHALSKTISHSLVMVDLPRAPRARGVPEIDAAARGDRTSPATIATRGATALQRL